MHLFLAVTLYDDKIHGRCSESILKNCLSLMQAGHTVTPYYNSDLYIDRSRNVCVNVFLDSPCSDIVFIDSDLSFDDDAILKLIRFDKDIVAGAYRYKKPNVEFPITLDFSRENNCKEEDTGLVFVKRAPTGLMRIKRSVFDRMEVSTDERGIKQYFRTGIIFPNDPNWYGEDTAFCKQWTDRGGEIFVEPRINFTHMGTQHFAGNFHDYLMGRKVDTFIKTLDEAEGIRGWTTEKELSMLGHLASQSADVVEIGSWKGRSTKALLDACAGTVYAVDHWQGSPGQLTDAASFLIDVHAQFMANVGHYPNLKVLRGASVDMAQKFNGNRADMVFIDAGHTYEECKADIEAWLPKCNRFICGHDYDFPDVKRAVDEALGSVGVVDSLWWKEVA
jgi:hypothetical protein